MNSTTWQKRNTTGTGNQEKLVFYVDMDNVLVDFASGIAQLDEATKKAYKGHLDDVPGIFSRMKPMAGAVEMFTLFSRYAEFYILSTAPWDNPGAWADKVTWVKKYLGTSAYKRLILSHHKELVKGDYLIDDRYANGAFSFEGELLLFGSEKFPNWDRLGSYIGDLILYDIKGDKNSYKNYPEGLLKEAYPKIQHNEVSIISSKICGCTCCGYIFSQKSVQLEFLEGTPSRAEGTALCPNCGKPAVLGVASGYPADDVRFLKACSEAWFQGTGDTSKPVY